MHQILGSNSMDRNPNHAGKSVIGRRQESGRHSRALAAERQEREAAGSRKNLPRNTIRLVDAGEHSANRDAEELCVQGRQLQVMEPASARARNRSIAYAGEAHSGSTLKIAVWPLHDQLKKRKKEGKNKACSRLTYLMQGSFQLMSCPRPSESRSDPMPTQRASSHAKCHNSAASPLLKSTNLRLTDCKTNLLLAHAALLSLVRVAMLFNMSLR